MAYGWRLRNSTQFPLLSHLLSSHISENQRLHEMYALRAYAAHSCVSSKKAYPVSLHSKTLAPKALDELYLGLSNISSETLHVLFHTWNALSPLAHFKISIPPLNLNSSIICCVKPSPNEGRCSPKCFLAPCTIFYIILFMSQYYRVSISFSPLEFQVFSREELFL